MTAVDVIFVQPGFGERGGVTTDVVNLLEGIGDHGLRGLAVGSVAELRAALRSSRRPVVHVFGCLPSPAIFGAMVLARARRAPLVWTPIFNPIRRSTWAGYGLLRVMALFDMVAPKMARFADAVIAATPQEADYFRHVGGRRVDVIPPGVDPPALPASGAAVKAFRDRVGVGSSPVVLTVARDNSRKALPFGHAVFAALRRKVPDARFLLVGPDADYARAGEPGVACPGWLDQGEIALAYQSANVLFVPSLYEGLPRAVIEAWRWSTPVVATDRVALAPQIDGVGGLVAPYGDVRSGANALHAVVADGQIARSLGEGGRQIVEERFLMPDLVRQTAAVYRSVREHRA